MSLFHPSARQKYRERSASRMGSILAMLQGDSPLLRVLIFIAMSAIFFLFLKITQRNIPTGLAPDSTSEQVVDTAHVK